MQRKQLNRIRSRKEKKLTLNLHLFFLFFLSLSHQPTPTPMSQQDPNELPWVRREREEAARASGEGPSGPPFAVFLVASALVAIAAVGSVFEFVNKNAIFGVLPPESPLYTPILALFALTGLPSAGWLFFKAVTTANEEARRQDKVREFFFRVWRASRCFSSSHALLFLLFIRHTQNHNAGRRIQVKSPSISFSH